MTFSKIRYIIYSYHRKSISKTFSGKHNCNKVKNNSSLEIVNQKFNPNDLILLQWETTSKCPDLIK